MTDVLTVTYEINDEKKIERDLYIKRENKDGSFSDVKQAMDIEADTLYKLITDQTFHTKSLRPQGKWILVDPLGDGHKAFMCSNCKGGDYYFESSMAFCPLCGSDNREVKDGSNKEF